MLIYIGICNASQYTQTHIVIPLHVHPVPSTVTSRFQCPARQYLSVKFSMALRRAFSGGTSSSRLRGHPLRLRKDRSRLDLRKVTLSQRVVNMRNNLPADVVTASSVKAFKNKLEAPSLLMHLCFSWFFLYTCIKNHLLYRVQGYVPLPLYIYTHIYTVDMRV